MGNSIVPSKAIDKVQFYEARITPWTTSATIIGVTTTQVTALQTKTAGARAAFDAHVNQQALAKAATEAFRDAVAAMGTTGAALIKQIRGTAEETGNLEIYQLALIPQPATPSPRPAPEKPKELTVALDETGFVNLKWKCNTLGGGVIYQVWRRIGGPEGELKYLAGVGEKKFIDDTLPAGSTNVVYEIQAARSTAVSPWATFNVNFGIGVGPGMNVTVTEGTPIPPAIAA